MSAAKQSNTNGSFKNSTQEVEVLYQKLGGQWYAFSMIEDEFFMAPVAEEKIEEIRRENQPTNANHNDHNEAA